MIAIILSTYNGEKYLEEQLDSLLNQTYTEFTIYIRDDGSIDNTPAIIRKYIKLHPKKIVFLTDVDRNLGVKNSFTHLLDHVLADIYFLCDQDDIWQENKLEEHMMQYANNEELILVVSDLSIINQYGSEIKPSFIKLRKIEVSKPERFKLLGTFPGCTFSFNRSVRELYLKYKDYNCLIHDNFIFALTRMFHGNIIILPEKLTRYRIHGENVIGVSINSNILDVFKLRESLKIYMFDIFKYLFRNSEWRSIKYCNHFLQLDSFKLDKVLNEKRKLLFYFTNSEITSMSFAKRKIYFIKYFRPSKGIFQYFKELILF